MRQSIWGKIGLAVVALLLTGGPACADDPEITVEVEPNEIFIGESVDYLVEIRNAKNPSPPDLSSLRPDFDVVSTGNESRNQSSTHERSGHSAKHLRSRLPLSLDAEANGQAGDPGALSDD
jgi:hypothetical protein